MDNPIPLKDSLDKIERFLGKIWRSQDIAPWILQLSFNEYDYLQAVFELDDPRVTDLALHMQVTKASASNMVSKLEKRELLQRMPSSDDGRVVLIRLTEKGRELIQLDSKVYQLVSDRISRQLTTEEFDTLERLLSAASVKL